MSHATSLPSAGRARATASALYPVKTPTSMARFAFTARAVANVKLWITNQYEHNGLRADGEAVVGRLLQMVRGEA